MLWVLLDVLIALAAVAVLGVVVLSVWRRVKHLSREVGRAGDSVARASDALAQAQRASDSRRLEVPDTGGRRA